MPSRTTSRYRHWLFAILAAWVIVTAGWANRGSAQSADEGPVSPPAESPRATPDSPAAPWFVAGPVDDIRAALDPRREIVAKRSANAKHFDLGEGRVLAIVSPRPMHYRDRASGEWRDIEAQARAASAAGTGDVFANDTNALRSRFSADAERGVGLAGEFGDLLRMWISPTIAVHGASGGILDSVPVDLSAPVADDNTITYGASHAEGRTEFRIGNGSVKLDVLFDVPPPAAHGAKSGRVVVGETLELAPGLALAVDGQILAAGAAIKTAGRVGIVDSASGEMVAGIAAPLIRDALGAIDASAVYLIEVAADGRVRFSLAGATDWLTDAARAFPVAYDPTVEILASADTTITEDSPDTSHGTATLLQVRGSTVGARARALLKFAGVNTTNFPTTIFEARFHAYCESVGQTGSTYKMGVWDVTATWNESTTWNSFNNAIAGSLADLTISTSGWYTFQTAALTNYVEAWRTDSVARDRGFAMSYELNTSHNFSSVWRSADYSGTYYDPFLSVVYDSPAAGVNLYDDGEVYRSFFPRTLHRGESIQVFCDIRNDGANPSGAFTVEFYASANSTITNADYFLGSVRMASIAGGGWADCNLNAGVVPSFIPTGVYYVGWIIDSNGEVAETNENDNTAYKVGYFLTVDPTFGSTCGMAADDGAGRQSAMAALVALVLVPLWVLRRRRTFALARQESQ